MIKIETAQEQTQIKPLHDDSPSSQIELTQMIGDEVGGAITVHNETYRPLTKVCAVDDDQKTKRIEVVVADTKNKSNDDPAENSLTNRDGWNERVAYAVHEMNDERRKLRRAAETFMPEISSSVRDPNRMLNVTITTVMLLASGRINLPIEYFMWTELYLRTIRNEHGQQPRNIASLLTYLAHLKEKQSISYDKLPSKMQQGPRKRSLIPVPKSSLVCKRTQSSSFEGPHAQAFSTPRNSIYSTYCVHSIETPMANKIMERLLFPSALPKNSFFAGDDSIEIELQVD